MLAENVTRAAGVMTIVNEAFGSGAMKVEVGDTFTDRKTGLKYRATEARPVSAPAPVSVPPAAQGQWT